MSRYHKDRDDKGAWKKGAGPYSKSYAKTTDKSPSMRGYQTAVEGPWSDFYKTPEAGGSVQDLIRGRQVRGAFKVDPNFGLSAALPRGHRPSHRAGKFWH